MFEFHSARFAFVLYILWYNRQNRTSCCYVCGTSTAAIHHYTHLIKTKPYYEEFSAALWPLTKYYEKEAIKKKCSTGKTGGEKLGFGEFAPSGDVLS